MNFGMHCQEICDRPAFVSCEVVGDHMDLFAAGLIDHNVGEERRECGRSVSRCRFAQHLAGLGVEGGIQRQGAVTKVLKAVPFGASRAPKSSPTQVGRGTATAFTTPTSPSAGGPCSFPPVRCNSLRPLHFLGGGPTHCDFRKG